jgi:subtilase family serine protease
VTRLTLLVVAGLLTLAAPAAASTKVDYGPISHKGLKKLGAASTSQKLPLQIGLIANQSGLQNAVKAASNPSSGSYGKYPSLSTLQSKYGASSSKRKGVVNAFKKQNVKATVDVTHLRVSATPTIGKAQKLFGTKWAVYKTKSGAKVALPVNTPKLPSGMKGNVDTVAGTRLQLSQGSSSAQTSAVGGGTPTRTGTPNLGCTPTTYPSAARSASGLFPNQILTAYGIAPLQAAGFQGQGARLAIVGEAPTPTADVNAFRSCFGTSGTSLKIHNAGSIKPIVESSLDAMVSSMVAPKLANFDLWVHPLSESDDDGDALGFLQLLAQPLQATTNGAKLPNVISVSYGICESQVAPYTASVTMVERQLTATAALGITTVVAAGDTGSSACARGVSPSKLTSSDKQPQASWPATSPWVLAVGGTNLTLDAGNAIVSTGVWNDTV